MMRLFIIVIAILGYGLCLVGGYWLYQSDEERIVAEYKNHIAEKVNLFEKDLDVSVGLLYGLSDYFTHSESITREGFKAYAESVMVRAPVVFAMGWMEQVEAEELEAFEKRQQMHHPDYKVVAVLDEQGTVDPEPRSIYYPITYVSPFTMYPKVAGIDLSGQAERKKAFDAAIKSFKPHLTEKLWLFSEEGRETGYMAVLPVRSYLASDGDPYKGIVTVVYSTTKVFFDSALSQIDDGVQVKILDLTEHEPEEIFTRSLDSDELFNKHRFVFTLAKKAGRITAIEAIPSRSYINSKRSLVPIQLSILLFVLATLGITNAALLMRRESEVRELVDVRTEELNKANHKLSQLASTDALTGIANRRSFDDYLAKEYRRAKRHDRPLTLMLLDLDYFKEYNDFYGHKSGDECLQEIAALLGNVFQRAEDHVSRFGGEEFAVILPGVSNGARLADNAVKKIRVFGLPHARSKIARTVTVSLGFVTVIPSEHCTIDDMIIAADEALYTAKDSGRNCYIEGRIEDKSSDRQSQAGKVLTDPA